MRAREKIGGKIRYLILVVKLLNCTKLLNRFKHCNSAKKSSTENVEVIELSSSDDNEAAKEKEDEINSSDVIPSSSTSEEDQVHRNHVIAEELKKIKDIPPNLALVQTFYEHPWSNKDDYAKFPIEKWNIGRTSEKDKIRTATFRHLWKEGFYLTAGDKFGADFLAYPGKIKIVFSAFPPSPFYGPLLISS